MDNNENFGGEEEMISKTKREERVAVTSNGNISDEILEQFLKIRDPDHKFDEQKIKAHKEEIEKQRKLYFIGNTPEIVTENPLGKSNESLHMDATEKDSVVGPEPPACSSMENDSKTVDDNMRDFYDEYSRNIQSYSARMKSYTGDMKKNKRRFQKYMDLVNKYIKSMQCYVNYLLKNDSCSKICPNKSIYSKRYRPY
ncbi:hypothetical protein HELRODRAFT_183397 [Helobdella robusta]|uniref:Uncharacterized protein n=1 Tax=Helobdella robusta TaxID=6412 RepID=T1FJK4_HELRO|nr:hypothetical protein HELRODRAFT_183397 [Helobdella robusta]ESO11222.1 hypothetical protein HELRODRAFT_183397 [Helobdella robusta]